ncbi:MAG: ABC transporter ATP-binding protein [Synergistaceae bacterium]|nr:ABC transporter ATP-binding protein [Synergistaceae bacterium]
MLLEAKGLSVRYGDVVAVHGVDISVAEGELVSIIGANGAGKTSILRALMGLEASTSESLLYRGEDISCLPPHLRADRGIRMVPERSRIFPNLTVYENLRMGCYRKPGNFSQQLEKMYSLFPILAERSSQWGMTLSGGEQQQLAIARALVSEPRLLLVDEVSMGLMPKLVSEVFDVLKSLNRETGLTILLVEQSALLSLEISTRAYVLETGEIVLEGPARQLQDDERVQAAYLGM